MPWYDKIPWKYLIPGFVGIILTFIFRDVIPRIFKGARSKGDNQKE